MRELGKCKRFMKNKQLDCLYIRIAACIFAQILYACHVTNSVAKFWHICWIYIWYNTLAKVHSDVISKNKILEKPLFSISVNEKE